ncbi:MAG: hypothetical protein H8E34_01580 [Bacteroidetes bacterium]|nr:hypothetical protein [Bacteroidota bacterium]MBL6943127.1 hypothetical protein [Bacteroidales bacterium]
MKKTILFVVIILFVGISNSLICQEINSISQARKDNVIELLNYRFKGGYYTFEKIFLQNVTYPPQAIGNCIVGIAIVSFRVSCEGEVYDIRIKTPLGYGIDNEISSFFGKTSGHWNTCKDEKYTKFEVPIQFRLVGTETNTEDALLILEADNPGYVCNSDEYYIKKLQKLINKGKNKRVLQYIDIMIRRNPYNTEYYEMKKKALGGE